VTGLFRRTPEAWRALGAPESLWDVRAAFAAYCRVWPGQTGYLVGLDALRDEAEDRQVPVADLPPDGPFGRLLAHRWYRWARPAFLAAAGALTAQERQRMDQWPRLYRTDPPHGADPAVWAAELAHAR
jgi:hypothetical protein